MKSYSYGRQTITKKDIEAVTKALTSDWLTQGPAIDQFEQKLCEITGAKFAVAVSNGTAALHVACLAAGVTNGDEGITTPMTFAASANCIEYCGGSAKFVDIDSDTGLMDTKKIEQAVTKKTKVLIPVHYAGQSCDMEAIQKIANKHKLVVIEDAAHAIGSSYKGFSVGSGQFSQMTTFSFHPVKTITTGEGGAVTTNDPELYRKLKMLRTHGITKETASFTDPNHQDEPWYYQMQMLGFNYRLTDIQAALGISQLEQLPEFVEKRSQVLSWYKEVLGSDDRIKFLQQAKHNNTAWHLAVALINFKKTKITKTQLFAQLKSHRIFSQVHYIPVTWQPYYQAKGYKKGQFKEAEKFYEATISLPMYPALTKNEVIYISQVLQDILD